jgi:hypothetical protein
MSPTTPAPCHRWLGTGEQHSPLTPEHRQPIEQRVVFDVCQKLPVRRAVRLNLVVRAEHRVAMMQEGANWRGDWRRDLDK